MLFCTLYVCAQSGNKYVVKLKNGIDIECVSYSITSDNFVDVTYADGSTVSIDMSGVEKIVPLETVGEIILEEPAYADLAPKQVYVNPTTLYYGPEKSPVLAGALSFIFPGVGQFYNGHIWAGVGFVVGALGSGFLMGAGLAVLSPEIMLAGVGVLAVVYVSSIVHAVIGAERVNMQRGYALGKGRYLNIEPAVLGKPSMAYAKNSYAYGVSIGITF